MAHFLAPEIKSLIIDQVHPADLVNVACSSRDMYELSKGRLTEHCQLKQTHRDLKYATYRRKGMAHSCLMNIANEMTRSPHLSYYIRNFNLDDYDKCEPNKTAIDNKLLSLISKINQWNDNLRSSWLEDISRDEQSEPLIAALLANLDYLQAFTSPAELLKSEYIISLFEQRKITKPLERCQSLFPRLKALNFTSRSDADTILPLHFLLQAQNLQCLKYQFILISSVLPEKGKSTSAMEVLSGRLPKLGDLHLADVQLEFDTARLMLYMCPHLKRFYFSQHQEEDFSDSPLARE